MQERNAIRGWIVVLSLGGLALSGRAAAQEPPTEWTFTLGALESNEFSRVTNGFPEDDLILDNVSATIGVSTRKEHSRFGLFGRVGGDFYRKGPEREQIVYGAGFAWDHKPSSRFGSVLSAGVDRGLTAETLSELGALAPEVRTTGANAAWSLQYQMGPRTSVSTAVAYNFVHFETDRPLTGSQIVLGESPFREEFTPLLGPPPPETGTELELPNVESDLLGILAREGFSSLESRSHAGTVMLGMSQRISEYSSFGFDFGGGYRTIETTTLDLREGAEAGFRFWGQRRVGQSSSVGASYQLGRSLVVDPATTIQSLVGGYGYYPRGKNFSLRFSAGASYYQAESGPSRITPVVDGTFSTGLTRTTSLSAAYRREFAQSLGFGSTLLIDYGSLALSQKIGAKIDLSLIAGASFASDPLIEPSSFDARNVGGTLTYRVVESLSLGTSFFALDSEQTTPLGSFDASRNLWSFFVTYTTRWR